MGAVLHAVKAERASDGLYELRIGGVRKPVLILGCRRWS